VGAAQNGDLNKQPQSHMKLDHATIVTGNLEAARTFLCSIIGLSEGPRPPFGVRGHWLYANDKPVVHLIDAGTALPARPAPQRIDHVALRIETAQEWSALLERLRLSGLPYELGDVPLTGERQLFVAMAPGVVIELVTDQQPPTL
jgi:catechol 2,3-dioxygenase-like lactoylglutathione lyase family enzyme